MSIDDMPPLGWDNGEQWTTAPAGQEFERWIGANTRFERHVLGKTRLGFDLAPLTIGDGPETDTMYINSGIHGTEYAAREATLQLVKDWAIRLDSGDTELEALLSRRRFVIMPTSNPDGRHTAQYGNSLDVDPAQDGFTLHEAERTVIERIFSTWNPVVMIDLHEYNGDGYNLWTNRNRGAQIHPDIDTASHNLEMAVHAAVQGEGYATAEYPQQRARALGHTATYRHCLALLTETRTGFNGNWDPRPVRVHVQLTAQHAAIDWFDQNIALAKAARNASLQWALQHPGPDLHMFNKLQIYPENIHQVCVDGYELEQPLPALCRDHYGIETTEGGTYVPMRQAARGFIPELMDPEVDGRMVRARPRLSKTILTGAPTPYVRIDGETRPVTRMILMQDGQRRHVEAAELS